MFFQALKKSNCGEKRKKNHQKPHQIIERGWELRFLLNWPKQAGAVMHPLFGNQELLST
jgi:hypothetical protein